MSLTIRCSSLDIDKSGIISFLKRFLTPGSDTARFDWLYRGCPHGQARVWLACDAEGNIVGVSAAFPRRFIFQRSVVMGWVLGDFCLAEEYRTLGPALQLQRATLDSATSEPDFYYDFPSKAMMAIYGRLGIKSAGSIVRWAKPLRLETKLERSLRSKRAAALAAVPGNALLRARGWRGPKNSCEVRLHVGLCGEEFSELNRSVTGERGTGIWTEKSAAYVNWRFLGREVPNLRVFVARQGDRLLGCLFARFDLGDARILDVTSVDSGVVARLLYSAVSDLASLGAHSVNLTAGEHHPWSVAFRRAGFRPRESSPIVVGARQGSAFSASDFQKNWFLMEGERDS